MAEELFSKILVAVDGSSYSNKALEHALGLSKKHDSRVLILHVVVSPVQVYGIEGTVALEPEKRLTDEGRNVLRNAEGLAKSRGVKVESKLVEGHPVEEIVREAGEGTYDLVIVGSRGLGRVKSFLLGSVSDRVSHYCKCPVLIVKP